MTYLFRLLFGFVEFRFTGGFYENFINECFESNKDIKNIALCDGGFTASCSIRTYKTLHRTALRHGGKVSVIRKRGLPFLLRPLKNRMGFLIGAVLFLFIISFLGGFVWNVQIVGNSRLSDTMIRSFLENSGLKTGAMWSSIDRSDIAWEMMGEFEDIAWVHINKNGTTAVVEINETTKTPKEKDEEDLKGAKVFRRTLEAVAYRQQSRITVRDVKSYRRIVFFGLEIPLYIKISKGDMEEISTDMLTVKDTVLPIGVITNTQKFLRSQKYDLTDKALLALAQKKLKLAEEKAFEGYTIINRSPEYKTDEDKCTASCAYVVRKNEQ